MVYNIINYIARLYLEQTFNNLSGVLKIKVVVKINNDTVEKPIKFVGFTLICVEIKVTNIFCVFYSLTSIPLVDSEFPSVNMIINL